MQRERLTITLDTDLLHGIDSLIDHETLRNRSQTIEHLLREGIGLHQLQQAFLFIQPGYLPIRLEQTVALCLHTGIKQFLVTGLGELGTQINELASSVRQLTPQSISVQAIPADFGSGGALLLQKQQVTTSFLIAYIGNHQPPLPTNLPAAYIFHRQHHAPLTSLLHSNDGITQSSSGLFIAEPELLQSIPAGIVGLEEAVFPVLVKESKVRGYLYTLIP